MTTPSFKSEEVIKLRLGIELAQPYDAFKPFYKTTSGATAETVVTVSEFMTGPYWEMSNVKAAAILKSKKYSFQRQ